MVPYGGYTVVRIFTGNPGYWLMHCHQMMHAIEGMDVMVRVAPEKAPKPPKNFPMNCGHFDFSYAEFQKYLKPESRLTNGATINTLGLLLNVLILTFVKLIM